MLDEILVVDLESTCWEEGDPPAGQTSDIIEIGVAHLHVDKLNITKNWSVLVKPTRSEINEYCTKLNGVTQEAVNLGGHTLEKAFKVLEMENSRQRTWASWGNYDRKKMEDDSRALGLTYPMSPRHINVKTLFTILYNLPREPGMDFAIFWLNKYVSSHWELKGRHHSGKDDANNIALILAHLIGKFRDPLTEAGVV